VLLDMRPAPHSNFAAQLPEARADLRINQILPEINGTRREKV
jgi:hypothetical protein